MQRLFTAYSQPLRGYIRHHWPLLQAEDVEDLAAEFLSGCLTGGKPHFLTYDPAGNSGTPVRLRTYLRAVLDNFLRNHHRNSRAKGRAGGRNFESLDTIRPAAHQESGADGIQDASAGVNIDAYDRQWAQHILNTSFLAIENGAGSASEWLPVLRPWILADPGDSSLKEIALAKGTSHAAVRAQLYRLRKAWRDAVRSTVARTVSHPEEIDDELRHLAAVLSRHPAE